MKKLCMEVNMENLYVDLEAYRANQSPSRSSFY